MSSSLTNRRGLLLSGLLFLGLGIFVFAWGLQYKLSLYYPPQSPIHSVPAAKLLSNNERAVAAEKKLLKGKGTESRKSQHSETCLIGGLFLFISLIVGSATGRPAIGAFKKAAASWPERSIHRLSRFGLAVFSFRPPPIRFA